MLLNSERSESAPYSPYNASPHREQSTETSPRIDENDRSLPLLVTKAYRHRLLGEFELRTLNRFVPFITLTYSHELEPEVAPTPSSVPSLLSSSNVGQVSISGVRPSWTDVRVDGMDANDPVFRYSPAGHPRALSGIERIHGDPHPGANLQCGVRQEWGQRHRHGNQVLPLLPPAVEDSKARDSQGVIGVRTWPNLLNRKLTTYLKLQFQELP